MSLYDKVLPNNKPEQFKDIEEKINKASNLPDTIAKYREEIMEILKNNEAEELDDENTLNGLITELEKKKLGLKTDLWKTPPCKIDLSNNTDIANFWKGIVDDSNPMILWKPWDWWGAPTAAEKAAINTRIVEALEKVQFVHDDWKWITEKTFQLFKWSSTDMTDIVKTSSNPLISQLLNEKNSAAIDNLVKTFVNSVKSTRWKTGWWNPFYISTTKLDEKGKDEERKVAIRIALYLYFVHKIINPNTAKWETDKFSKALYTDINEKLDQLINNDIPKVKWIHNAKVELWYLKPEYDTLKQLNLKAWDINGWTHNLSTTPISIPPINLTSEFETWAPITKDIDEYRVIENGVSITDAWWTSYKASFIDWMWNTGDLFAKLASKTTSLDFYIEVWWKKIKIWKLTLSNTSWNAKLKIDIDDETTINAAFNAAWVTMPKWPFNFEIPVKWIKNVSNWLSGCKASLTKPCKIAITTWGTGPTPTPTPWTTVDIETSISNLTEVSREEAERVAEEQLRERYEDLPILSPDRINLFFRRDYIKERYVRKIMEGQKWLSREDRDINATERQQLQKSQDTLFDNEMTIEDIEKKCPNAYNEIDKLCKNYMWTPPAYMSSMDDDTFQNEFSKIINADPPLDGKENSILKLIWTERNLTYWSNILIRMKMFVAHQKMANNILNYIKASHTDDEINTYCRTEIKKYMDLYDDLPRFLKDAWTNLDDPKFLTTLKWSTATLNTIAAQTMKLKMQIIQKWSAAYKIKQKRWWVADIWNGLDGWILGNRKKEKNLWFLETFWWVMWILRTWLVVWPWVLWWMLFWPLWTAIATGSAVWLRTLFSKYSHYTKEYEWQMKNEAVDLINYRNERNKLQSAVWWRKWYQTNRLWGSDKREARHWNRYVRTTHWVSEETALLANNISTLANKDAQLSPAEIDTLKDLVSEWYARLTFYKETWQNFLWSNDVNKAEGDYKNLYAKLISWAKRLWWVNVTGSKIKLDEWTIKWYKNYTTTMNSLKTPYEEARKRFKGKRAALGIWWGLATWAVAWWLSYLTTQIWWKIAWRWDEHNFVHAWDESSTLSMVHTEHGGGTRSLHDVFKDAMSSKPHASWYELYVSPEIDSIPSSAATTHTYSSLTSKIASIRSSIPSTDTKTLEVFDKAMELHSTMPPRYKRSPLERAIAYASNHWADVWNQYLFWERFAETVKDTIAARTSADTTGIPINRIWFRRPSASAAASVRGSAWNLAERSMNWVLRIKWMSWVPIPVSRSTFKRHEWNVSPTSLAA